MSYVVGDNERHFIKLPRKRGTPVYWINSLAYFLSLDKETEEANELLNRGKLSFEMVILQNTNAQIYSIQPISLRVQRVRSIGRIPK